MTGPLLLLTLTQVNGQVWRVLSGQGEHVGNLKLIGGAWKFKAVGYDAAGVVMPGHGPLTHQHNRVFAALDEALICRALSQN